MGTKRQLGRTILQSLDILKRYPFESRDLVHGKIEFAKVESGIGEKQNNLFEWEGSSMT